VSGFLRAFKKHSHSVCKKFNYMPRFNNMDKSGSMNMNVVSHISLFYFL
jgi:hypothetical protein